MEKTKEIEENKKNISMILNNLDIALFIINEACVVIECNQAFLTLLSQSRKDVVEKSLFEFSFLSELLEISKYSQWKEDISLKFRKTIKSRS